MLPVYELPAAVHHRLYQSRLPARDPLADHRLNTQRLRGAGPSARPARQPEHCPQGHKRPPLSPSPLLPRRIQTLELDEFWSFAGSKKQPRWTWYAFDRERRKQLSDPRRVRALALVMTLNNYRNTAVGRRRSFFHTMFVSPGAAYRANKTSPDEGHEAVSNPLPVLPVARKVSGEELLFV